MSTIIIQNPMTKTRTNQLQSTIYLNPICVEEHRRLGGSIISRLDNAAFVGLIYELLVLS